MERILAHYGVEVQLGSRWRSVRCPFHEGGDVHASARASLDGFACLACGLKGDGIKVIMEVEHVEFGRATELYEGITGVRHNRVSKGVKRKSWGIPPFGSGDLEGDNSGFQARVRGYPDLG